MKKYISGVSWVVIGLVCAWIALGSEKCIPHLASDCLLRKDGENMVVLIIGVIIFVAGLVRVSKIKRGRK